MRISIFSGRVDDPQRRHSIQEATRTARAHGADLLLLPGNPQGAGLKQAFLQNLANDNGLAVFGEVGSPDTGSRGTTGKRLGKRSKSFTFLPKRRPLGPFVQQFRSSRDASRAAVSDVVGEFADGQRVFELGGTRIGVLLCGENNILRRDQPRYPAVGEPSGYDILLNPAHTSMGRWYVLHERFARLSRGDRWVIHCANNKHKSWGTSLCVRHNGQIVVMGDFDIHENVPGAVVDGHVHEAGFWRVVTIDT